MRKIILLLTLGIILFPIATYAGIYGTLKGKVVDEEGNPVQGATVMIQGTRLGGYAKQEGKFSILNISPGEYTVKVSAVGYQPYETKVKISTDEQTDIVVKLSTKAVTTKGITVTVGKMVDNSKTSVSTKIDSKAITNTAREGVTAVVGLSAGVFNSGNGYNIRGSRSSETQIRLDGLDVGNQFTGAFGVSGTTYYPMVSAFATEEVQVITGSFPAEYGEALGGIVNTVAKTGRDDKYEGFLRYRTEFTPLWGSQESGIKVYKEGLTNKVMSDGPGAKLQGTGENKIEAGFGGPLPFLDRSTFFISSTYMHQNNRGASYEIYDPAGNNIGLLPNNQTWVKNITGVLNFALSKEIDFKLGGMFGMSNFENSSWAWLYDNTPGAIQGLWTYGVPENQVKQGVWNNLVTNAYARINHRLSSNSFYEFTVSNTSNNDETSKRADMNNPSYFSGFNLIKPLDEYTVSESRLVPGHDKMIDIYTPTSKADSTDDRYMPMMDKPQINPFTGYYEGQAVSTGTKNAYGLSQFFAVHGNGAYQFRECNFWQFDGNYNLNIDGEFDHMIKSGFETRIYKLSRNYNGNPWDGSPFFDIYTDEYGGNIFINPEDAADPKDKAVSERAKELSSAPYRPLKIAAYVQDQIKYKGIIFNPGIRLDYFDANAQYRTYSDRFVSLGADSGFAPTKPKFQISPRLGVTYPITDNSNISISYGMFFKTPELQYMYDAFNQFGLLRGNSILGNPNIDPQRSTQYNVTYSNALTEDIALNVSAYYKDIYNQVGITFIPASPDNFFQYTVADYGNARGLEFELIKRPTDHIGARLNYTLSSAVGTSSDPGDNYNLAPDPYTGIYPYPLTEFPANWDRAHRVNFVLDFVWGEGEGPSIGGIHLLENTLIDFTTIFQSGTPYTKSDIAGRPLGEKNAERQPDFWRTDLRFTRTFKLADIIGNSVGGTTFQLFVDVTNLFNRTAPVAFYSTTSDPDDDGISLNRPMGNFPNTSYYAKADYGNPLTFSSAQYNLFGERMYSANADLDNNGVVTPTETYQRYLDYVQTAMSFRGNYQAPRQVYVGVMFNF